MLQVVAGLGKGPSKRFAPKATENVVCCCVARTGTNKFIHHTRQHGDDEDACSTVLLAL